MTMRRGFFTLLVLTALSVGALAVAQATPPCSFGGSVHGQCVTQGGQDCFLFRFVVHGENCRVDLYRAPSSGSGAFKLVANDIQDSYVDCPDWSGGPYDYKLVTYCTTCPSGATDVAYLMNISCP
jgi:hypothetical protein